MARYAPLWALRVISKIEGGLGGGGRAIGSALTAAITQTFANEPHQLC